MEIGGYRELDLRTGLEYYGGAGLVRLNAGRFGIYHALRCMNCHKIKLPYYLCETVRDFLLSKGVEVSYYHIGADMLPQVGNRLIDTAILLVNYFGLMKSAQLTEFVRENSNVIIDNTQGFYQPNILNAYSVYSPRKFFGVSDGCYVIGPNVERYLEEYPPDMSSDSSIFLFSRIETGGNANYVQYQENEKRLNEAGVRTMSELTHALLDNIDYVAIRERRQENYDYAATVFQDQNLLPASLLVRETMQAPMAYPLLIENENLRYELKKHHIYVGQWWKYLLNESGTSILEKRLSRYLLPIPIDQRYSRSEIKYIADVIVKTLSNGSWFSEKEGEAQ